MCPYLWRVFPTKQAQAVLDPKAAACALQSKSEAELPWVFQPFPGPFGSTRVSTEGLLQI